MLAAEEKALEIVKALKDTYRNRDKTKKPFFIKVSGGKLHAIMQIYNLSKISSPRPKSWEDAIVWRYVWIAFREPEVFVEMLSREDFTEEELPKNVEFSSWLGT